MTIYHPTQDEPAAALPAKPASSQIGAAVARFFAVSTPLMVFFALPILGVFPYFLSWCF
jgi:hypothetical protein